MISRRVLLAGPILAGAAFASARAFAEDRAKALHSAIAALERRHGGRLGVAMLDSAGDDIIAHRGDELFPMCSTFKFLAAVFVLARVDLREEKLSRRVVYTKDDLVPNSPVTENYVGTGLSVRGLCDAAMTLSDNTAANLLLASFGGPSALTAFMRSQGDNVTRLDRTEPALNEAAPGDPRDSTTPVAMLEALRNTVLGATLERASRAQLTAWLVENKTGEKRLKGGAPEGWMAGDKTGAGGNNTANDIAVFWPPGRAPIIVTAYYTGSRASGSERDAVLGEVGRLAAAL